MQVASANWSDNSVATVWFDASAFDKDEFDSCKYVDDLKRYVRGTCSCDLELANWFSQRVIHDLWISVGTP